MPCQCNRPPTTSEEMEKKKTTNDIAYAMTVGTIIIIAVVILIAVWMTHAWAGNILQSLGV